MRRQAFTLIELLVVVSIIALLIAILLPALSRTRYSAKVAQCLSDKHQWGVAIHSHAIDHTTECSPVLISSVAVVAGTHRMCHPISRTR